MKTNIGSQLPLDPTSVTVIGAMNGKKSTGTLAAHAGMIMRQFIHKQITLVRLAAIKCISQICFHMRKVMPLHR